MTKPTYEELERAVVLLVLAGIAATRREDEMAAPLREFLNRVTDEEESQLSDLATSLVLKVVPQ